LGPPEESEATDFSQSIDTVASDYGWTIEQILDLTADQLTLFLKAGAKRRKDEMIMQLGIVRIAYASVMSKEGQRAYQDFMDDMKEKKILPANELSKVGLEIKKG